MVAEQDATGNAPELGHFLAGVIRPERACSTTRVTSRFTCTMRETRPPAFSFPVGDDSGTKQAEGATLIPWCEGALKMIYFKGMLLGFGALLLGCLVTPIALMIWAGWKTPGGAATVSFSPMGLVSHLGHSLGFWIFIVVLVSAVFVLSVYFQKR